MKLCYAIFSFCTTLALGASYQSPTAFFHFQYDEQNWEIVPEKVEREGAADVDKIMNQSTLVTVQRKQADEKYHARFNVVVDSLEKFKDSKTPLLVQYQKHATDFLKSQRFQILSVNAITLPKVREPAVEIIANQRDFGLKFRQILFVRENKAYLLTVATRTEKFEAYQKETQMFLDSFEFNPKIAQP